MSASFKIYCGTNKLKVLESGNWPITLGADGAFEDSNASYVIDQDLLKTGTSWEILIIDGVSTFHIKFTPDDNIKQPQGLLIPIGFKNIVVKSIQGDVNILRYNFQMMNTTIAAAYVDSNAQAAVNNDILYPGDIIVAESDTGNYFDIEFTLDDSLRYSKTGLDIISLSNANI